MLYKKKKVKNSQYSINREESFVLFFIQVYEALQWNQTLHNILFIFGSCQFIAFLWNPIVNSNIDDEANKFNYRIIVYCCSRFDIILTKYFKMDDYLYLIPLCCIIIFELIPIGLFYIVKGQINQQITAHKISSIYITACSLYSQIFNMYLFVPFMALCFFEIFHNFNEHSFNEQIYNVLFSTITIILLVASYIMRLILCLESIDMKLDPLRQFNQTFLDLLLFVTIIIQQLTYVIFNVGGYGIMIQGIVIIFRSLLKIYQLISSLITCLKIVIATTFILNSYAIIESLLLITSAQNETNNINDQITILLTPLLSIIFMQYYEKLENTLFDNISQVQNPEKIKYYFGKFINDCCQNQSQLLLLQSQMLKLTKDKCPIKVDEIQPFQILSMDVFPIQIMNRFHLKKLKKLLQTNPRAKQLNVIHYIAVLYQMGFHYLAYKQISMFFGRQNDNQVSSNQSSNVRVHTKFSEMQGGRSISQGEKQSSSKDSKSQDLGEKLQQIEMQKKKLLIPQKSLITGIQKEKMIFLRRQIQMKLQFQFLQFNKNIAESTHLSLGVKLFLEGETRNQQLKDSIIKSLNKKLVFFQEFQAQKLFQSKRLFEQSMKLSQRFYRIEQALLQLYGTFPSQKLQSVITFFYAELLNNYIEAYKLKNYTSISDEKLITMHKNINTQFLSRNLVFLNIILDEENQQLVIAKSSDNASKFLLRTTEELKKIQTIEQLLPQGIVREHYLLVQRFMKNGQSKFFLRNNQSYFKVMNSIIKPFSLFFDIHFTANSQIRFYVFLQELSNQSACIFIDVNENVGGLTENLFDKLGYSQDCIELFYDFDFSQVKLHQLFTKSSSILEADSGSIVILEFQFPKESFFINDQDEMKTQLNNSTIKSRFHLSDVFQDTTQLNKYELVIVVNKHEIYEYFYYILEIKEIKILSRSDKEFQEHLFTNSNITEQEGNANSPKSLMILNRFIIKDKDKIKIIGLKEIQESKNNQIDNIHFKDDLQLLSPNLSLTYQFTPNTSQMLIKKQQDFFNKQIQDLSQSFQDSNQVNQLDDSNIRMNIQSHIAKNQEILDDNSQGSTHAGIKKALFYKKYEALDYFIQHQSPISLKLFFFFNMLSITMGIVFFIIVLVAATIDLGQFLEEIDMIQLHSGIMIPHDIQYGIRQTVVTYQAYLSAGAITKAMYTNISEPLIMNTNDAYLQFKENTFSQLSNHNLQPFFQDKYINLVFMKFDATSVYTQNLSIVEGFMTMIQYYYMFKLRFEARLSPANQTYQVFQFANVMNINFWLEDLTVEVWNYSKNRSIETKTKWNVYWIIFLTLTVIPMLISVIYYRIYKQKFDKYLNMFRYCTAHKVNRDIDRYKSMLKVLSVNSELIFNYSFDINQKEQSIQLEKIKYDQEQLKVKEAKAQSQFKQLNYFAGIIALLIFWVIYLILSVIINEQTGSYLTQYYHTADLYKQIQDMTWSSSSLYRNRDFRLLWKNFTYLTDNDLDELYTYIYKGIENVDNFNTLCNTFDQNLYQISSQFLDFFGNIQSNSVCDTLGQEQLGFLFQYCNKSLEGTLQQGLLPALTYMKKQIQTQMAINNFTKRVEYNLYENEGALIIMVAFQIMTHELKAGMVMILNNQLQVSNAISITYILLMAILIVYNLYYLQKTYLHQLFLARRFITLLPTITLFLDDQFERHMRILLNSQKQ